MLNQNQTEDLNFKLFTQIECESKAPYDRRHRSYDNILTGGRLGVLTESRREWFCLTQVLINRSGYSAVKGIAVNWQESNNPSLDVERRHGVDVDGRKQCSVRTSEVPHLKKKDCGRTCLSSEATGTDTDRIIFLCSGFWIRYILFKGKTQF
ncbi:hypothetical protein EVAR_17152_1 [Eumeta japonica]|uniref:Uncharacterized protein n=1 Tax=Eumeta variegata TaxID=151549 RepID=A0A4C1UMP6_EUMVA|nr:hypothetical protein EVAR_17152_1 [Eumeta japonica]